jgi:hypothetical protein
MAVIWSAESDLLGAVLEELVEASRSLPDWSPKGEEAEEGLPFSSVEVPAAFCVVADAGVAWPFAGIAAIKKSAAMAAAEKQATRYRRAP